jgi:hypothetical protein
MPQWRRRVDRSSKLRAKYLRIDRTYLAAFYFSFTDSALPKPIRLHVCLWSGSAVRLMCVDRVIECFDRSNLLSSGDGWAPSIHEMAWPLNRGNAVSPAQ